MDSTMNPAPARSIWAIVGDVFLAPTRAFESFRERPNLWVPLILVTLVFAFVAYAGHDYNQLAAKEIYDSATNLSPQARQNIDAQSQFSSPMISGISMLIMFPIITIVGSLIAWLFISFFFGQKAKFVQVWSTNLLAGLIACFGALISVVLMFVKGSAYVSLGPAALMSGSDFTSYLYSLLYMFDIFSIWWIVVSAIGYSVVFKITKAQGATIAIVLWLIGTLLALMRTAGFAFAGVETSFF